MDLGQIPDVVQLNVRGRPMTTLLSVLTKDAGSKLAAMFTGQLPVFKDKDDRYFIDADPNAFEQILLFLRDGTLCDYEGHASNFGRGFGEFGFGRGNPMNNNLMQLYKEAQYFELEEFVGKLEDYKPVLFEKRLKDYRKATGSYDECLTRILEAITGEEILYGMDLIIQLRQETQTVEEPKCCDHNCLDDSGARSFGQTQSVWETDTVVNIPAKVDIPLFKMLYTDLQRLGYQVHGRLAICHFRCNKKSKKTTAGFGGFGFHPDIYCCMEKLFLLKLQLANSPAENLTHHTRAKGGALFGQAAGGFGCVAPQPQAAAPSLFGGSKQQQAQQPAFGFGSGFVKQAKFQQSPQQQQSPSGFSFGAPPSIGALNQPILSTGGVGCFGSSSAFGQTTVTQQQSSGFGGFGSASPGQQGGGGLFGSASPGQQGGGGLFGSTSPGQQGGGGLFGSASSGQQGGGGLFGSASSGQQGDGGSFGQASSSQPKKGLFSGTGSGFHFGEAPTVTTTSQTPGIPKGGLFGGGFQLSAKQDPVDSDESI